MGARINAEKPKNTGKTLSRLLKYIGKSKALVILLIIIMVVVTVTDLAGPAMQGAAIDTIKITEIGEVTVDMPSMMMYLGIMAVLFIISATMTLFQGFIAAKLSQNTVYSLRNDLFKKISRLPIKYTLSRKTPAAPPINPYSYGGCRLENPERRGDLIFTVVVETPKGLNSKQRELMRQFAEACGESNYSKKQRFFRKNKKNED